MCWSFFVTDFSHVPKALHCTTLLTNVLEARSPVLALKEVSVCWGYPVLILREESVCEGISRIFSDKGKFGYSVLVFVVSGNSQS